MRQMFRSSVKTPVGVAGCISIFVCIGCGPSSYSPNTPSCAVSACKQTKYVFLSQAPVQGGSLLSDPLKPMAQYTADDAFADKRCQDIADVTKQDKGLAGRTWVAWLSFPSPEPADVRNASERVKNKVHEECTCWNMKTGDKELEIFHGMQSLSGGPRYAINYDQDRNLVSEQTAPGLIPVWTGTQSNGAIFTGDPDAFCMARAPAKNLNPWSSTDDGNQTGTPSPLRGVIGNAYSDSGSWTDAGFSSSGNGMQNMALRHRLCADSARIYCFEVDKK